MMVYNCYMTIRNQRESYLFGYYNRPVLWFQRRFMGPFLILLSLQLNFMPNHVNTPVNILLILSGVYYLLRPLLLLSRIKFTDSSIKIIITDNHMEIGNEKGSLKIYKNELVKVIKKKNFLMLKIKFETIQYINIDLKLIESRDKFLKEIELFKTD